MNEYIIFSETLRSIADVPDRAIEEILDISKVVQLEKGENFIRAGDVPTKFAFVVKGLFRYYYLNDSGQEFTKGFFPEHSFLSSYSAMIQKRESYFTIEALEHSLIIVIPYAEWHELNRDELSWNKFLVALLEKGYCNKEAREREFLLVAIFILITDRWYSRYEERVMMQKFGTAYQQYCRTTRRWF